MKLNFEILEKVQVIDVKIFDLEVSKKEGPKELEGLQTRRQQNQNALALEESKQLKLQNDLAQKRELLSEEAESIKKKQDRSNEVRNQKEYQASLREIEGSRMEMAILEEDMKLLQERAQKQNDTVEAAKTVLDGQLREISEKEGVINEKLATLETEIARLTKERDALAKDVPADILNLYDRVKKRSPGGKALLPINDNYCPNCFMAIPPQKFNEIIRMENVYVCGTCQMLHYYRGGEAKVEA